MTARNKLVAAGVVALFLLLGSYAYFLWLRPTQTMNHGELLTPVAVPSGALAALDGRPVDPQQWRGRWVLLTVDSADCHAACRDKLWRMRQLRLAQGQYAKRVERAWLLLDDATPADALQSEFDGTHFLRAKGSPLLAVLPAGRDIREHIYLIDPLGNVMLRYARDADPRGMIKDLTRLLKYSRVG